MEKLEKEIERTQQIHESKFMLIKEEALKVEDMLNEERRDKSIVEEKKKKEIQFVENSLEIVINQEKKQLREQDMKIARSIDEKF